MNSKLLWVGVGLLTLIGVIMAAALFFPQNDSFRGTLYEPARPAPEISLTQGNGSNFRLGEMRGKVVLLFFGYTSCPDVCPTTLSELRRVVHGLGADAARAQVVFVTVDPERDTPEKLGQYLAMFDPSFIGLSGSTDELQKVWQAYGVYREVTKMPNSATGYLVNHTARLYVIDLQGNLRLSFAYGTAYEDILHDIEILLEDTAQSRNSDLLSYAHLRSSVSGILESHYTTFWRNACRRYAFPSFGLPLFSYWRLAAPQGAANFKSKTPGRGPAWRAATAPSSLSSKTPAQPILFSRPPAI
ncbi:MAG: hypothetical protein Fur0043_04780 [Anaerolineales bacterium]